MDKQQDGGPAGEQGRDAGPARQGADMTAQLKPEDERNAPLPRPNPTVGQTLYMLNIGNRTRYAPPVLRPVTVTKVGRKWFDVKRQDNYWNPPKFSIETWREKTEYSANYCLYASEQDYADSKEAATLAQAIEYRIRRGSRVDELPLASLRQIVQLLGETTP